MQARFSPLEGGHEKFLILLMALLLACPAHGEQTVTVPGFQPEITVRVTTDVSGAKEAFNRLVHMEGADPE